jgi:cytochrome c peroxidase
VSRANGPPPFGVAGRRRAVWEWGSRFAAAIGMVMLAVALLGGLSAGSDAAARPAVRSVWTWNLPANFPTPRVPANNPMSSEKADLGRFLFYDTRLSGNGTQSCGGCHQQKLAFTDGRAQSLGSTGQTHPRSSLSLANAVYNATLTWANPSLVSMEKQMEVPLFGNDPVELGITDAKKSVILKRLGRDRRYRAKFAAAFPGRARPISWQSIVMSIASFQRTLISGDSRYDRYLARKARLTPAETRGKDLFFGEKAECFHCHSGVTFSDQFVYAGSREVKTPFHNTGLYNLGGTGAFPEPNRGVFELTERPEDMGAFRAPTLRNVGVTAPYMHDGSVATLKEVVDLYAAGGRNITSGPNAGDGRANPYKDPLVSGIDLNEAEKADLVAFLSTLTDRRFLTDPRLSDPFRR